MTELKLEVGKTYRDKQGDVWKVVAEYPYEVGSSYYRP